MNSGSPGEDRHVSDRGDTTSSITTEETSSEQEMRPLPDGGLTEGLPEWLRRPPAWRNVPRNDVAPEAGDAGLALPEPDTSVIDPRTLVDVADLPLWLQQIAARGEEPALMKPDTTERSNQENTIMQTGDQNRDQTPEPVERTVAFEPVDKKKWEVPDEETKVYGGGPPKGPNMMMVVAAVAVILIIVMIVVALAL
jgi:hypothetical protein